MMMTTEYISLPELRTSRSLGPNSTTIEDGVLYNYGKLYMGDGNDSVTVQTAFNTLFSGGNGFDFLQIYGGGFNEIRQVEHLNLASNNNTIFYGGSGHEMADVKDTSNSHFYLNNGGSEVQFRSVAETELKSNFGIDYFFMGANVFTYEGVNIRGGASQNNYVSLGADNDNATLYDSVFNTVLMGSGNDQVNVYISDRDVIDFGIGDDMFGTADKDNYNQQPLSDLSIIDGKFYMGAGNDEAYLAFAGTRNLYDFGADNDYVTALSMGYYNTFNLGSGHDYFNGFNANNTIFRGQGGEDTITIRGVSDSLIDGGTEADYIEISQIANTRIRGGYGNDTIIITNSTGTGNSVYGDAGNDTIYNYSSSNTTLWGGEGNDYFESYEGQDTYWFSEGSNHDTINDYSAGNTFRFTTLSSNLSGATLSRVSVPGNSNGQIVFQVSDSSSITVNARDSSFSNVGSLRFGSTATASYSVLNNATLNTVLTALQTSGASEASFDYNSTSNQVDITVAGTVISSLAVA
jgi:Ca2+-binding RTX toxin-like protein